MKNRMLSKEEDLRSSLKTQFAKAKGKGEGKTWVSVKELGLRGDNSGITLALHLFSFYLFGLGTIPGRAQCLFLALC